MSFLRRYPTGGLHPRLAGADDDRALLARFAAGDDAAFAALVDRHGPLVRGVCRRVLRDDPLADDAFQATFFLLARKADGLRLRAGLANWLYVVARRAAVKLAKRKRGVGRVFEAHAATSVGLEDSAHPTRHSPDLADLLRALDEELDRLPDRYRGPLVACFLRAKTQDEAAREFGWSVSTLRRRLARGRELLKVRLTARGATLGAGLLAGAVAPPAAAVPAGLARSATELAALARTGGPVPANILALASEGPRMGWKVATVAVGLFAACGLAAGLAADPPRPPDPGANPVAALAPVPAGPQPWVTVKGRVLAPREQALPAPGKINVQVDKEHCLAKGPLLDDAVVVNPTTRGLKNVWVYLAADEKNPTAAFPAGKVHPALAAAKPVDHAVDQPCCQFVPRILAARVGDTVVFKNSAPIAHNVHLSADANESFNATTPPGGTHRPAKPLAAERSPIVFKCDIHPWMSGRIMVFDHPYFAVTDDDGNFAIKLAPAGAWRVFYRHEKGYHKGRDGNKGFPVEVTDAGGGAMGLPPVEFEFPKP